MLRLPVWIRALESPGSTRPYTLLGYAPFPYILTSQHQGSRALLEKLQVYFTELAFDLQHKHPESRGRRVEFSLFLGEEDANTNNLKQLKTLKSRILTISSQ